MKENKIVKSWYYEFTCFAISLLSLAFYTIINDADFATPAAEGNSRPKFQQHLRIYLCESDRGLARELVDFLYAEVKPGDSKLADEFLTGINHNFAQVFLLEVLHVSFVHQSEIYIEFIFLPAQALLKE